MFHHSCQPGAVPIASTVLRILVKSRREMDTRFYGAIGFRTDVLYLQHSPAD
jgi:hypothetical protein